MMALSLMFELIWHAKAPLPEPRAALLHAVVDGRLLTAGGTYWKDERKHWSTRCDFFDPKTNRWSPGPSLPEGRADSAMVEVDGSFLFLGGTSDGRVLNDVLAWDGRQWASRPEMRLPAPRSYAQAALIHRRIYLFPGLESAGDIASARREVWMWNLDEPRAGWREVTQIPEPARSNYAFAVLDGKAWLFGGVAPDGSGYRNLAEVWSYDSATNKWSRLPDAPQATRAWAAAVRNGKILLLGGYTDQFAAAVYAFQPHSREFKRLGDLPRGLADARFLSLGEQLLVTGGESGVKIRSGDTWAGTFRD